MKWIITFGFLIGMGALTTASAAATFSAFGVDSMEHPEGLSLRQDSSRRRAPFFLFYSSRGHYGGGLSGGK